MKIDRLISIIMLLLERKIVTATELANIFEVSTRTIYRDIDTISKSGIPIVSYPGQNGGIGIMDQYKIDKMLFSASDISSLIIALGGINSAISGKEIVNTLSKVKGLIPENKRSEIESNINQVNIDLTPWVQEHSINKISSILKTALNTSCTVKFGYTGSYGQFTLREVEPYRLLYKGSSWYLQGFCLLRNELRTFRFLRMEELCLTENIFKPRELDFTLFANEDNSTYHNNMIEVNIKFNEKVKKSITEYYGDNVITSFKDNIYNATIMIFDNELSYNILFSYGDNLECVSPKHVRAYLKEKSVSIASIYNL